MVAVGQHCVDIAFLLLLVSGPVPLCLLVGVRGQRGWVRMGSAHAALAWMLTWYVLQTALALTLGSAGLLTPQAVLLAEVALGALGVAILWRTGTRARLSSATLLRSVRNLPPWNRVLIGTLCCSAAALAWELATAPITEGDSVAYHLPTMACWYQTGSFVRMEQWDLFSRYPFSWEALSALFIMPFREDFLVALPNLGAWGMLALATYCLASHAGCERLLSLTAAALTASAPIVLMNVNTMHVDLALAAFAVSAFYFASSHAVSRSPADLALSVAAAGMVAGVKTSGLIYALLAVAIALGVVAAIRRSAARVGKPSVIERGIPALGVGLALWIGGFWYVRNWVEMGNALGPVAIRIGGLIDWPGAYDAAHFRRTSLAEVFQPWSYVDWQIMLRQVWKQFGIAVAVMAGGIPLAGAALLTRERRVARRRLAVALALCALTAYMYVLTPYSGDNGTHKYMVDGEFVGQAMRYAFPCWAALAVTAALAWSALGMPTALLAVPAMLTLALYLAQVHVGWLAAAMAGSALLAVRTPGPSTEGPRWPPRRAAAVRWATAVGSLVALVAISLAARCERDRRRAIEYGGYCEYLRDHVAREETIGYFMSCRSYLLYGRDLSKRVVYIPLASRDSSEWTDYMRQHHIDLLAAGPAGAQKDAWDTFDWLERGRMPVIRVHGRNFHRFPFLYRLRQDVSVGAKPQPTAENNEP